MTRDEFNKKEFNAGMCFKYQDAIYPIVGLQFKEALLGLDMFDDPDDLSWVRCESGDVVGAERLRSGDE